MNAPKLYRYELISPNNTSDVNGEVEQIILKVVLPGVTSITDVSLDVSEKIVEVKSTE